MCGSDATGGEDIVEEGGELADLLRHGGDMVGYHTHALNAHAQTAQLPRKEVCIRILEHKCNFLA